MSAGLFCRWTISLDDYDDGGDELEITEYKVSRVSNWFFNGPDTRNIISYNLNQWCALFDVPNCRCSFLELYMKVLRSYCECLQEEIVL